ncbi:MAG: ZPR1 zinc finger domain-containing protein [Nanoarchaeota archaeon]|nr:ZPR1 zinc finger domain-containing protein [Nanoarchaeota archaeon]
MSEDMPQMDVLEGEKCPVCSANELTLTDAERDIPFFGQVAIFSMSCGACGYHKADVECLEEQEPAKYSIDIDSEEDMKIRVIKSSFGTLKIAHVGSIEPGESANGYVTNIEGVLNRIKKQIEFLRDSSDDKADVKKAKNLLKKITKIMWGQEKVKITLDDPTGNSAIVSEKATITKLKAKK